MRRRAVRERYSRFASARVGPPSETGVQNSVPEAGKLYNSHKGRRDGVLFNSLLTARVLRAAEIELPRRSALLRDKRTGERDTSDRFSYSARMSGLGKDEITRLLPTEALGLNDWSSQGSL